MESIVHQDVTTTKIKSCPSLELSIGLLTELQYVWGLKILVTISNFRRVWMLYVLFWAIQRRLKFICQRFGTLCLFHLHRRVGGWNRESVPNRSRINFRRRWITQKKANNSSDYIGRIWKEIAVHSYLRFGRCCVLPKCESRGFPRSEQYEWSG
jgi:hypothetical protein